MAARDLRASRRYATALFQTAQKQKSLDAVQKDRFLKRALVFKATKHFEFVEMQEEEHMSLLISAAAVQLTFGLQHFLMDHFHKIYVMKRSVLKLANLLTSLRHLIVRALISQHHSKKSLLN